MWRLFQILAKKVDILGNIAQYSFISVTSISTRGNFLFAQNMGFDMSLSEMAYMPLNVFTQKKNLPHRAGFPIICLEEGLQTKPFHAQASVLCRAEIISTADIKEILMIASNVSMPLIGLRSFLQEEKNMTQTVETMCQCP